jgi:hypothetical protein
MYSYVRTAYVSVYTICYVRLASTELSFPARRDPPLARTTRRIAAARPIRRRRPRPPTPAVRSGSDGRRPVKPGPPRPPLPVRRVNVARVQCSAGGDQLARRGGGGDPLRPPRCGGRLHCSPLQGSEFKWNVFWSWNSNGSSEICVF